MQDILPNMLMTLLSSLLSNPLIGLILVFLPIVMVLKTPWFKGKFGESIVARSLKTRLNPEVYKVLNDVMIPDQAGGTTQIDHVVFSALMIVDGATPCHQGSQRRQFVLGLL